MRSMIAVLLLGGLPPEETASIQLEQQKAQSEIAEKHGNKAPAELTAEERREIIREQAEAEKKVLEKHGVTSKEWAVSQMRETVEGRAQVKEAREALEAKQKAEADAAAKPKEEKAVTVQRGFSEENPATLEEKTGGAVTVEKGLPEDAKADLEAAAEADKMNGFNGGANAAEKSKGASSAKGSHKADERNQR
jgi:hypothetical protein